MAKKSGIPGVSFSAKRASGISAAKSRVARATGVPTTRSGRQKKIGRAMSGGCLLPVVGVLALPLLLFALFF